MKNIPQQNLEELTLLLAEKFLSIDDNDLP